MDYVYPMKGRERGTIICNCLQKSKVLELRICRFPRLIDSIPSIIQLPRIVLIYCYSMYLLCDLIIDTEFYRKLQKALSHCYSKILFWIYLVLTISKALRVGSSIGNNWSLSFTIFCTLLSTK
jgi:hypothetical protein